MLKFDVYIAARAKLTANTADSQSQPGIQLFSTVRLAQNYTLSSSYSTIVSSFELCLDGNYRPVY